MKELNLNYRIRVASDADPETYVDVGAKAITQVDPEDVLITSGHTQDTLEGTYNVVGVIKGKPDERWAQEVQASNETEAEALATQDDDRRVVAAVQEVQPPLVPEPDLTQQKAQAWDALQPVLEDKGASGADIAQEAFAQQEKLAGAE